MSIKPRASDPQERVEQLRIQLAGKLDEVEAVERATLPLEEAQAQVRSTLDHLHDRAGEALLHFTLPGNGDREALIPANARPETVLLRMLGPDRISKWLSEDLARQYDAGLHEPGLPLAERHAQTAKLREEARQFEREEENAILAAAETGVVLERRADMDPAVFLEFEREL